VRYQVTVDTGVSPATGRRQQARRRYATEKEARAALAEIADATAKGQFVARSTMTVEQVCADYIAGRRKLRQSSLAKLGYDLGPLREQHGSMPIQRLTRAHLDRLVEDLLHGGTRTAKGRVRRPWSAVAVHKVITTIDQVLADAKQQGLVARNVAENVNRVAQAHEDLDTYPEAEVGALLAALNEDRLGHAWELALSGLRRGEIAGLRWADVDFEAKTLSIVNNRVMAGNRSVENDPKSAASRRTLPLPDRLVAVLRSAKARQSGERLALGGGAFEYVVSNEAGEPYSPAVLSRYWRDAEDCRCAAHQAACGQAHLRHADAPARCAVGGDRGMDRPQGREPDHASLCALAGRGSQGRRGEFESSCDIW